MEANWKHNCKYDHAFAIVRINGHLLVKDPCDMISVIRVVWDRQKAEREAARLNALNSEKGSTYFWQHTRIERLT